MTEPYVQISGPLGIRPFEANTMFCARAIGPLMLIIGAIVLIRFDDLALLMPAIFQDGPLAFVTGIFTLIVGVGLLSAHHHRRGLPAILITLLAILTIVRGVALMLAPDLLAGVAMQTLNAGPGAIIAGVVALLIGAYLTFIGWRARKA